MPVESGTRFGPYEILSPLGAGGMGEVYRARDTRLDRVVAIKVLPSHLGRDPEFRARFEREAKSISALNHPHICTLHDVGREGETEFLVMEYLEGESLAARLLRGPIPGDEALDYAVQIADALDRAHRFGIVHRDLKPANIFLVKGSTASGPGICKLLDFGLAKLGSAASSGVIETKLMTSPPDQAPLTARGSLLGTFQYMAPEQIEGQEADARSDIWAFGCVLYEMLTGRRAFEGKSQASLIASILERQPAPIAELQPMTPPALGRIVRTCLEKNPDDRFHTAHDLRLQLQWIDEGGSAAGVAAPVIAGRRRHERTTYAAVALAAVILTAAGVWAFKPVPEPEVVVTRFAVRLPDDQSFTRLGRRVLAISPDGRQFAYVANQQIYLRRMNEKEAKPIRGSKVDPLDITFSPDGEWIAFFAPSSVGGTLQRATLSKIAVSGGVSVPLASPVRLPAGMQWQGDTLVFASDGEEIQTVSASGGQPSTILKAAPDEDLTQPMLVGGGREVLFTTRTSNSSFDETGRIAVERVGGGERRVIVHGGKDGRLSPSGEQLFFIREGTLFVQSVNPKTLAPVGGPQPVVEDVVSNDTTGTGQYGVSDNGTLVFSEGPAVNAAGELVWVDRAGKVEVITAAPHQYDYPRLSPDGTQILVAANDGEDDIWLWDTRRAQLMRLTFGSDRDEYPVWSSDGKSVYYRSNPGGQADIFMRAADGTGAPVQITRSKQPESPMGGVALDPTRLLVRGAPAEGGIGFLALLNLRNPAELKPMLSTPVAQMTGEISPDGRWLAYQSSEGSTQDQVYVRPFPDVERGRWQISTDGGSMPMWSRDSRELFYRTAGPARLNVVAVPRAAPGGPFTYGTLQPLFETSRFVTGAFGRGFDISPDGKRFVMVRRRSAEAPAQIVVVSHWLKELAGKSAAPAR